MSAAAVLLVTGLDRGRVARRHAGDQACRASHEATVRWVGPPSGSVERWAAEMFPAPGQLMCRVSCGEVRRRIARSAWRPVHVEAHAVSVREDGHAGKVRLATLGKDLGHLPEILVPVELRRGDDLQDPS